MICGGKFRKMRSVLEKYKEFLPLGETLEINSLGEGNTPLVRGGNLNKSGNLFFKMEQLNPTGSFKDRFAAVETALMKSAGIKTFIATSSGNTGAALSAYAAKHELNCLLFVNEITPDNKLQQMLIYGAKVFRVKDFGVTNELSAPIFQRLQDVAEESKTRLVISAYKYSPDGMEGVKTIAYEIVEQLGEAPDHVFIPVGGGGLLSGIRRGFEDLKSRNLITKLPRVNAVQPELNDTIITPLAENSEKAREVRTTTSISGLAVQVDLDATRALQSVKSTGGFGLTVSDEDIYDAQRQLSEKEGIYVEPAGAASVAGYLRAVSRNLVGKDEKSVCILTGHGLKDASSDRKNEESRVKNIDINGITNELVEAD
jgi:threonine synthase